MAYHDRAGGRPQQSREACLRSESGILPPEADARCFRCGKASICRIGKDKTELCLEHFEIAMEGIGKLIKRLVELRALEQASLAYRKKAVPDASEG